MWPTARFVALAGLIHNLETQIQHGNDRYQAAMSADSQTVDEATRERYATGLRTNIAQLEHTRMGYMTLAYFEFAAFTASALYWRVADAVLRPLEENEDDSG